VTCLDTMTYASLAHDHGLDSATTLELSDEMLDGIESIHIT